MLQTSFMHEQTQLKCYVNDGSFSCTCSPSKQIQNINILCMCLFILSMDFYFATNQIYESLTTCIVFARNIA